MIAKPSEIGSYSGHLVYRRALVEAGVPAGVVNILTGGGDVGSALVHHPGVDGVTFTGSSAVGMSIIRFVLDRRTRSLRSARWAARTR